MEKIRILDGKNSDPGSGINIPGTQHFKVDAVISNQSVRKVTRACSQSRSRSSSWDP
jgi:hypothetical protein